MTWICTRDQRDAKRVSGQTELRTRERQTFALMVSMVSLPLASISMTLPFSVFTRSAGPPGSAEMSAGKM